jgi:endonuclease YncB( thermonuclease family)
MQREASDADRQEWFPYQLTRTPSPPTATATRMPPVAVATATSPLPDAAQLPTGAVPAELVQVINGDTLDVRRVRNCSIRA